MYTNPHNMTDDQVLNLKRQIAVMQKYSHGKQVEESFLSEQTWTQIDNPDWDWVSCDYRIIFTSSGSNPDDIASQPKLPVLQADAKKLSTWMQLFNSIFH